MSVNGAPPSGKNPPSGETTPLMQKTARSNTEAEKGGTPRSRPPAKEHITGELAFQLRNGATTTAPGQDGPAKKAKEPRQPKATATPDTTEKAPSPRQTRGRSMASVGEQSTYSKSLVDLEESTVQPPTAIATPSEPHSGRAGATSMSETEAAANTFAQKVQALPTEKTTRSEQHREALIDALYKNEKTNIDDKKPTKLHLYMGMGEVKGRKNHEAAAKQAKAISGTAATVWGKLDGSSQEMLKWIGEAWKSHAEQHTRAAERDAGESIFDNSFMGLESSTASKSDRSEKSDSTRRSKGAHERQNSSGADRVKAKAKEKDEGESVFGEQSFKSLESSSTSESVQSKRRSQGAHETRLSGSGRAKGKEKDESASVFGDRSFKSLESSSTSERVESKRRSQGAHETRSSGTVRKMGKEEDEGDSVFDERSYKPLDRSSSSKSVASKDSSKRTQDQRSSEGKTSAETSRSVKTPSPQSKLLTPTKNYGSLKPPETASAKVEKMWLEENWAEEEEEWLEDEQPVTPRLVDIAMTMNLTITTVKPTAHIPIIDGPTVMVDAALRDALLAAALAGNEPMVQAVIGEIPDSEKPWHLVFPDEVPALSNQSILKSVSGFSPFLPRKTQLTTYFQHLQDRAVASFKADAFMKRNEDYSQRLEQVVDLCVAFRDTPEKDLYAQARRFEKLMWATVDYTGPAMQEKPVNLPERLACQPLVSTTTLLNKLAVLESGVLESEVDKNLLNHLREAVWDAQRLQQQSGADLRAILLREEINTLKLTDAVLTYFAFSLTTASNSLITRDTSQTELKAIHKALHSMIQLQKESLTPDTTEELEKFYNAAYTIKDLRRNYKEYAKTHTPEEVKHQQEWMRTLIEPIERQPRKAIFSDHEYQALTHITKDVKAIMNGKKKVQ